MEVKVLEQSKNKLSIEIVGEDHTLCNVIKEELNTDSTVKAATYSIEHPLISNPVMVIEGDDPVKSLNAAIKKVQKLFSEMEDAFKTLK